MCPNSPCRSTHQARKCRLVSSGPLSQRILVGRPRWVMISSNTRVTLRLAKLVSTTNARHSRGVRIHHAQHTDGSSTRHRIMHEIQCPLLVRRCPAARRLPDPHAVSALLSPKAQPRFPVYPMHPFVVHHFSASLQQDMQAPIYKARV